MSRTRRGSSLNSSLTKTERVSASTSPLDGTSANKGLSRNFQPVNNIPEAPTTTVSHPVCMSFVISRELKEPEVNLLRGVVTLLDPSMRIVVNSKGDQKTVILTYDASRPQSVVCSIRNLITGISMLYSGPVEGVDMEVLLQGDGADDQQKPKKVPSVEHTNEPKDIISLPRRLDVSGDMEEEYERPLSLKGQRHVFLYRCRFSALKAIIDKCGCWNLRLASLKEKWPCLLVYCAKDRDTWMNAFKQIQKLEKKNFLRKKVSDSIKNVDFEKLEDLTQIYGQKNVCISLCVQSPSSPENPSVSVCGVESFVEMMYNIFVEHGLIQEDMPETVAKAINPPTPPPSENFPLFVPPFPSSSYNFMSQQESVYPVNTHQTYLPIKPSPFTQQSNFGMMPYNYDNPLNNSYYDNYTYDSFQQPASRATDRNTFRDEQLSMLERGWDNEYFFNETHQIKLTDIPNEQSSVRSDMVNSEGYSGLKETSNAETKNEPDKEKRQDLMEPTTTASNMNGDILGNYSNQANKQLRYVLNQQWRDEGWY